MNGPASIPVSLLAADPGNYPVQKPQPWCRQLPWPLPRCRGGWQGSVPREPGRAVSLAPGAACGAQGSPSGRLPERGALQGSKVCEPESLPGNPGCNSRGAQPRGSEKKQITAQAPSILIKILSPAEPPTPAQPVPISAAARIAGSRAPADEKKTLQSFQVSGEAGGPSWDSQWPRECDQQPCRWLAVVKWLMSRVTEQQSRCFMASSCLEWGEVAKLKAL